MSSEVLIAEAAALASAVTPLVVSVSPAAGAVVTLVALALKEEPLLADLLAQVIADFKSTAQKPLDFKDDSASLEKQLHIVFAKKP